MAFRTTEGLCFYDLGDMNLKQLIGAVERLKQEQEEGKPYQFVIHITTDYRERKLECVDILVDFRAFVV